MSCPLSAEVTSECFLHRSYKNVGAHVFVLPGVQAHHQLNSQAPVSISFDIKDYFFLTMCQSLESGLLCW